MPPVVVLGLAALVGTAAAVATWIGLRPAMTVQVGQHSIPANVLRAVLAVRQHRATVDELRTAAAQAHACGHASLAAALRDEAAALAAAQTSAALTGSYPSPIAGVADDEWTTYVRRSRVARPSAEMSDGRLGCYALSPRELADVGVLTDARRVAVNGRQQWIGTWADTRGTELFLANTEAQHDALAALARLQAGVIESRHADLMGRDVDGQVTTLSGLLGVARRAGLGGLRGWVTEAAQRKRFPETTAAFVRLNGIF